jgi:adenine-specific DNA-methyltransferase
MSGPNDPHRPLHDRQQRLAELLLTLVPTDGSTIGNTALWRAMKARLATTGQPVPQEDYWQVQAALVAQGVLVKGQGRGGSVRRAVPATPNTKASSPSPDADFNLAAPAAPTPAATTPAPKAPRRARPTPTEAAPSTTAAIPAATTPGRLVTGYLHPDKRLNNPEVGLVNPVTDPEGGKRRWAFNPHLDPALHFDPPRAAIEKLIDDALATNDPEAMREALEELKRLQAPYLNWAGKAERTSFEIDTVSLHVHERIDPVTILRAVRKGMDDQAAGLPPPLTLQPSLFENPAEYLPRREAIDFYRHERDWSNRLIAGDSLLVMNSLLQKESMAGRVQMIYIDPPYGIKYGSNFQPFIGKREVKDRNDADLTQEPEMIKAFRDTWELGIHSYLTYLRDRLLLARELLHERGSIFVQISDENVQRVHSLDPDRCVSSARGQRHPRGKGSLHHQSQRAGDGTHRNHRGLR